ncbi:MAG: efflux RND transporter periplasmic adaptor subunit [bacterium]|nr:efflux RND transporter periplasmic adaptor subunit [bacterium]
MHYTLSSPLQAFHTIWSSTRSRKKRIGICAVILIAAISLTVYAALPSDQSIVSTNTSTEEELSTNAEFTTVRPLLVSDASSVTLLGTVLSNETANIYPRREGIVEDILVDIGDTIEKNQVVALLLPKGVEGQSAAMISEKKARKSLEESNLVTATHVAQETMIKTKQSITEKETELMVAIREQEELLQKFTESSDHILQMQEQAFTAVQNARQVIEWILFGSNSITGSAMLNNDLLRNLGIHDSSNVSRYEVVEAFNSVVDAQKDYNNSSVAQKASSMDTMLTLTLNAISKVSTVLQYTPSETTANGFDRLTHAQLTDRLTTVLSEQDKIYKTREKLEDARNSFFALTSKEPELYQAFRAGNDAGKQSNKVHMIQQQIQTAHDILGLTEVSQDQIIERQKSMVDIADSMLQLEYANSGHRQIRSPFSGTVSKRFLNVGQIVSPSMPAFELTGVPTSLAKKAKAEVQFGLPEHLLSAIEVGDSIAFFLQTDEANAYTAHVTRKSPQVDMQSHTFTIQAKIPDDLNLPHQSSVRIRLTDEKKPIFRVPSSSVKRKDDKNYLWIINPETDTPIELTVSVTAEDGEFAEITGALTQETDVIIDPLTLNQSKND